MPLGISTELLAPNIHPKMKGEKGEERNRGEEKEKEKGREVDPRSPGPRGLGWGPPPPLAHTMGGPPVPAAEAGAGQAGCPVQSLVLEPDRLPQDPPCDPGHAGQPHLSAPAPFRYNKNSFN